MRRVLIYDRFDAQVCELSENDVFELTRHEVVNGAHELTITTTQVLEKGYRVLMEDDRGYWHEWVVSGIDEQHANGSRPYGSYYCVWSLQPDLMGTRVSAMPGVQTPVTAAQALDAALGGTSRWTRGTITNTNTGGASMYDTDGWSAMSTLVANWGGEVDTTIGVSTLSGVVSRQVDLYAQQGESTAKRRFDFGADLVSVRRTMADDPLYCRITPRGMGEATEGGGYGRRITIESVNDGKDYLENASMVDLAKLPDGNGGWEYPTLEVENPECETPSDLLTWSQGVLEAYTTPKVTYEINVVQAAKEGIDLQGVSLGDAVQIVDGKFNDLRLTGRVMEMTIDELAHTTTSLTIGSVTEGISSRFSDLYSGIQTAEQSVTQLAQSLSTADYIDSLLERINTEINATGGYTYIVPGNGILTFDVAVADPLNPTEAHQVVEIKGGSIRIANSKTAQGQWEWKTVFTSGHIAADLVTAAQLTTGYIGNASGTYWDLDNNLLHLPATTIMDDTTVGDLINQEIGGTNLLYDTDAPSLTKVMAGANRVITGSSITGATGTIVEISESTRPCLAEHAAQIYVPAGENTGLYRYIRYYAYASGESTSASNAVKLVNGQQYTISCWAKRSGGTADLWFQWGHDGVFRSSGATYAHLTTSWQRVSWTFTFDNTVTGDDLAQIYFLTSFRSTSATTVQITGMKLEVGSKATDWNPSPVDDKLANTMIRAYGSGVLVCKQGNTVGALVNSNGSFDVVAVTWSGTTPTAGTVYAKYGATSTIGQSTAGHVEVNSNGILLYGQKPNTTSTAEVIAKFGYADTSSTGAAKFTLGTRASGSTEGEGSVSIGWSNTASGNKSIAFGSNNTSSGQDSFAVGSYNTATNNNAVAIGQNCTASYANTFAIGSGAKATTNQAAVALCAATASGSSACAVNTATASGTYSFAAGQGTTASGQACAAFGKYNSSGTNPLTVGWGTSSAKNNIMYLTSAGALWLASTLTQNSDRRLKQHVAYLGDDANVIINRLKPAVFIKDGGRHYGFYAQDVQRADIWDTKTVEAQHTDESLDFDPLTLDYTALIAPLTAYVQNLEKRIEELERRLGDAE